VALIISIATFAAAVQSFEPRDQIEEAIANRQFPRALQIIDSSLGRQPQDWQLWTLRGRVLAHMDLQAKALEAYRHAIHLKPSYLPALEGAVEIEYSTGDPHARGRLNQIIVLQPTNEPAHAMLGELAFERHDCGDAVAHFERASNPLSQKPEALFHFGSCQFQLKHPDEAAKIFQRAVSLDPGNADAVFDLGLSLLEAKRSTEAINVLQPLADRADPESDVLNLLGEAYESAQRTQEAIQVLRRGVDLYPQDPQHYVYLASLCVKHNAYGIAGDVLNSGITRLPASATLRTMRGLLFILTGQINDAEQSFSEATRLAPNDPFGQLGMGIALSRSGRAKDSVEVLRAQVSRNPRDVEADFLLAQELLHQSEVPGSPQFEEAKAAIEKALAVNPDFVGARYLKAQISLDLHQDADAITNLEQTISLDPTFRDAIYMLLRAYARTGRRAEATKLSSRLRDLLAAQLSRQSHTVLLMKTPAENP
jgi:tetratricopeptide (TPR) repeat protein